MGSAASTTNTSTKVEKIRIDPEGNIWKLLHPPSATAPKDVKKQSRHSTGNLTYYFQKTNPKTRDSKNLSYTELVTKLEGLDKEKQELESKTDKLSKDLWLEKMKNNELAEKLSWYSQLKFVEPQLDTDYNLRSTHSASGVPTKPEIDKAFYEHLVEKLQTQLKDQSEGLQKRLNFEREMREKMEDVVRIHLGEKALLDAKNSLAYDVLPVSNPYHNIRPFCRSLLSGHGRVTTAMSKNSDDIPEEPNAFALDDEALRNTETEDTHPPIAKHFVRHTSHEDKIDAVRSANSRLKNTRSLSGQAEILKTEIDSFLSDDVDDLLNSSSNSLKTFIDKPKRYDVNSAKSRDSGYQDSKYL